MDKIRSLIRHPAIVIFGFISWLLALKFLLMGINPAWQLWAAGIYSAVVIVLFVDLERC